MAVLLPSAARPRQELALAVVEGAGANSEKTIWRKVLPLFPINKRTAHLIKVAIADTLGLRVLTDKFIRAAGTKFERLTMKFGDSTMTVVLRGAEVVVPNETSLDLAGLMDAEAFAAGRFGEIADLTQEWLTAAAIFNTTNFGAATNSAVAYTAANLATIDFIGDVIAATRRVKAKGEIADTVIIPGPVYERVKQAAKTINYVKGQLGAGSDINEKTIQQALAEYGIKQVLIADAYYNTASEGVTPVLTQIWANTYIWVGKSGKASGVGADQPGVVQKIEGVGANVYWEDYASGVEEGTFVESYPDIPIDSVVVRIKMSQLPYIGNARAGDLIGTQYA